MTPSALPAQYSGRGQTAERRLDAALLRATLVGASREKFRVLFLDKRNPRQLQIPGRNDTSVQNAQCLSALKASFGASGLAAFIGAASCG